VKHLIDVMHQDLHIGNIETWVDAPSEIVQVSVLRFTNRSDVPASPVCIIRRKKFC
jgi:hypothetical protein